MDYKQQHIFNNILKYFKLKSKNKIIFKQYRNLNEFRYFDIERINPTHRILLKGKLKRKNVKDNHYNKMVNVGEILLCIGVLLNPHTTLLLDILVSIAFYTFIDNLFYKESIINVTSWYRRFAEFGKNTSCNPIC